MASAVTAACQHTVIGEHFLLRIKSGSDTVIISTSEQKVVKRLCRLTALTINGRADALNVYAATGEEVLRRAINGISTRTPSERLMANLRVRTQGVEIIQARMMGETKSATITFWGPALPRFLNYCRGEMACHPYRATVQLCKTCCSKGHRMDVCPQPDAHVCRICGTIETQMTDMCACQCASCGGEHVTGDRSCTQRLEQPRATARKPKRTPSAKRKGLRRFSSEEEKSELRYDRKPPSTSRHSTPTRHEGNAARTASSLHLHANQDRGQGRGNEQQTSRGGKQRNHRFPVEPALDLWDSSSSKLHLPLYR
ncbi:hypothetical protein HPB51_020774 [Rhipicephalus microplus]|uniref:Uncharacterized protein n=1 Tax=Rhipicephalus microplus TaxID=6941 RepID=A0A9J6DQ86_RHIMP|nr:hypothetical protein HPB51_020774 [Rhipicephalus microplus]